MRNTIFLIVFIFFACSNQTSFKKEAENQQICDSSSLNGVLIFDAGLADRNRYSLDLFNQDQSLYGQVVSTGKQEPFFAKLKDKIRAYYPDYYIIHFDAAAKNDTIYCVKVGKDVKTIKVNKYVTFLSWSDYIIKFYCVTDRSNPVRTAPEDAAATVEINDYDELSFKCIEVKGDWVKVTCLADCEGCPSNNSAITGWIRWRKDGTLIIKQKYAC